jgi:hypothetical protein
MATSKCVKCDSHRFELVEQTPARAVFKYNFVQCASCGGVVGVVEYFNIGGMLQTLAKKLGFGDLS